MNGYGYMDTRDIAKKIKDISYDEMMHDYKALSGLKTYKDIIQYSQSRSRMGNKVVDYYTFVARLYTRGKYNINFFDFCENIEEFKKKKFIKTMFEYYSTVKNKNNTKNEYIVYKEVYNICISAINIFRPLIAMEIYARFEPKHILDPCAGWGGRAVGAAAINIMYTGFDINKDLREPYAELEKFLETGTGTLTIQDATQVNYSTDVSPYDMVFTSPPYYFLEKYNNNVAYASKDDMNKMFYIPLFSNTYKHLMHNGYFILNVNIEIYENVCIPLLGEAIEKYKMNKSKRQNVYTEYIYIWKKDK
jgi:tRNA1(Val) A37 N6-methylase TrmN6